jgi:hypothetical protein
MPPELRGIEVILRPLAIERLSAQFEGIRRADKPGQDGTVRNSAFYSILFSEWPAVRGRLQALLDAGRPPIAAVAAVGGTA